MPPFYCLVPLTGLEPVQYRYRGILSPLCLPIPPQRRLSFIIAQDLPAVKSIEGESKISWGWDLFEGAVHRKRLVSGQPHRCLGDAQCGKG